MQVALAINVDIAENVRSLLPGFPPSLSYSRGRCFGGTVVAPGHRRAGVGRRAPHGLFVGGLEGLGHGAGAGVYVPHRVGDLPRLRDLAEPFAIGACADRLAIGLDDRAGAVGLRGGLDQRPEQIELGQVVGDLGAGL
jgi:hypothetical protein